MIELLGPRAVRRIFTRGAMVCVACADAQSEPRGPQVAALLEGWSGRQCRITMGRSLQVALPAVGNRIQVISSRPDGIYRLPARVEQLAIHGSPEGPRDRCLLEVRPEPMRAVREQARGAYRLSGSWRALVAVGPPGTTGERFIPTRVLSLSGAGFLIEDPTGLLNEGRRFRIALSCGDGALPVEAEAEAVRRDQRAGEVARRWGCCFRELAPDDEARIVRVLHQRIRARLRLHGARTEGDCAPQTA